MNLLIWIAKPEDKNMSGLLSMIRLALPLVEFTLFTSYKRMLEWLRIPPRDFFAAVFIPDNAETLREVVMHREFFMDRNIFLLLPDTDQTTSALGLQLNPRFLGDAMHDLRGLMDVLKKQAKTNREQLLLQ